MLKFTVPQLLTGQRFPLFSLYSAWRLQEQFRIFDHSNFQTMVKQLFLFAGISLLSSTSFGQNGDVKVIKDPRLDALVAKQSEITPPDINPKIKGFRIQLAFDSERQAINAARATFVTQFPRVDTYVEYNAPNYYLKVGDFRTRLEAEKIKSEVEGNFPTSFIIEEDINLPRLRKDEQK